MPAKSCPACKEAWPIEPEYNSCPRCGNATVYRPLADALTEDEAQTKLAHLRFDRYYERRELDRRRRGDPTPEALGAIEAKRIIEQGRREVAELEAAL